MTERNVRCENPACERFGVVGRVRAIPVGSGFEARPTLYCATCGFAVPEATPHGRALKAVKTAPEKRG